MPQKRKPQTSPGPAFTESQPNDDFTLPAALYYDAIYHFANAVAADTTGDSQACDRLMRSSVLAAFSCFEAMLNQVAFAYAHTHRNQLGQIELDVLEEMETTVDERGDIIRRNKFYKTEARFTFLACFLSGKDFDRSSDLWQRFQAARELRDRWTHPKPPFDTWSLTLPDVHRAIAVVRDLFVKLDEMMGADPRRWLRPIDEILAEMSSAAQQPAV